MVAEPTSFTRVLPLKTGLCLLAAAVAAGCSPTRFPAPFLTAAPQPGSPAPGTVSVTTSCPPGSTRLGGGYYIAPDGRNNGLIVRGSFPSDQNAWTLEVENTSPIPDDQSSFMAVAYCARRTDLVLAATVRIDGAPAQVGGGELTPKTIIKAPCLAPAVLTGGGFRLDGPLTSRDAGYNGGIQESAPDGSVWHVEFGEGLGPQETRLVRAYAVCTTGLPAGAMVEVSKVPAPTPSDPITAIEAVCDRSSFTTAGGFRLNGDGHGRSNGSLAVYQGRAYQTLSTSEFQRWNIQATTTMPGGAPITAIALCATIP